MLIHDNNMKMKSLDAIASAKDCSCYRILPTGELQINHYFKSYVFLAYVRGHWFASHGMRKGSSMDIPEKGIDLFACGNNSIWIPNENKDVDISSSIIPIDKNTHAVLFAFSGKAFDVMIADGSLCSNVIATSMKKSAENTSFLILTLTSLIRQYDSKAADDILKFWFKKNLPDDSDKDRSDQVPLIDWENTKKKKTVS